MHIQPLSSCRFNMHKTIILAALFATASCRPQFRSSKSFASGPAPRQPHYLTPTQNLEPQQIPSNLPSRKSSSPDLSQLSLEGEATPSDYEILQNQNARYQFSSDIEDHINDQSQHRQEIREGTSVTGSYSYSDGYYNRTVNYVADEHGYRVTGMEAVPLDGPHIDLSGTASVSNSAHGTEIKYKVVSVPVEGPVGRITEH